MFCSKQGGSTLQIGIFLGENILGQRRGGVDEPPPKIDIQERLRELDEELKRGLEEATDENIY